MADSSGVNEAGKAWISISVQDNMEEGFNKIRQEVETFAGSVTVDLSLVSESSLNKAAENIKTFCGKTKAEWEQLGKVAGDTLKSFGESAQAIGEAMTGVFDKVKAPAQEAVGVFSDFDDTMRMVRSTITGATDDDFEKLTEKAKLLGRTMSFTASEVAGGMLNLARNGFSTEEIDSAITSIMDLARGTGTDVATTADYVSTAIRSFGLSAEDTTHVCDVMMASANTSAQTLTDFGEALKYSAKMADTTQMSIEDYAKTIGTLANYGVKGSSAGTGLRQMLTNMVKPQSAQAFSDLGVAVSDAEGNLRPFAEILSDVAHQMEGMGTGEKMSWFYTLFGQRAMAGGASLLEGQFDTLNDAIDNAAGRARATAEQMDAGIGGSFRMMTSAMEGAQIAFGEAFGPSVTKAMDALNEFFTKSSEWIQAHQEFVNTLASGVAVFGAVGLSLTALGKTAQFVGGAISGLVPIVGFLGKAFGALIGISNPVVGVLALCAGAAAILGAKYMLAKNASDGLSHSMAELRKQHAEQEETDNKNIARLVELAEKERLNNQEMVEAQNLIRALDDHYKGLGITLDVTAGKLSGVAEAQKKLADAQRAQRRLDLKKELDEAEKNYQTAQGKWANRQKKLSKATEPVRAIYDRDYTLEELQEAGISEEKAVYNPQTGKYLLPSGADERLFGGTAKENLQKQIDELATAEAERNKLQAEWDLLDALEKGEEEKEATAEAPTTPEAVPVEAEKVEVQAPSGESPTIETPPAQAEPVVSTPPEDISAEIQQATAGLGLTAPESNESVNASLAQLDSASEGVAGATANLDEAVAGLMNLQQNGLPTEAGQAWVGEALNGVEVAQQAEAGVPEPVPTEVADAIQTASTVANVTSGMNQMVGGPGSMAPMKVDLQAWIDTAENTRQSAVYLKKIWDYLNRNQQQTAGVFGQ